jgi:carboxylate-amine ligase
MQYMVETRTPVCRTLADVHRSLRAARLRVAMQARRHGAVSVASGVAPFGVPVPAPITANPRYYELADAYPFAMSTTGTCGCHVHVAVPTRQAGVEVLRRLRPWLPALIALTANSPIWEGRDTGWASTRYVFASRWPTAAPALPVASATEYDAMVAQAVATGQALDVRNVYYLARLSPRYPTIEVRVADMGLTVEETVAYAALVRSLVSHALTEAVAQRPALVVAQRSLEVACADAARVGLGGNITDVVTGRTVRTWDLVDELVGVVLPHLLTSGEAERVLSTLYRVRVVGGGAERQRRMLAEAGSSAQFVAALAAATKGPLPAQA